MDLARHVFFITILKLRWPVSGLLLTNTRLFLMSYLGAFESWILYEAREGWQAAKVK
jgi:hypothetical protein